VLGAVLVVAGSGGGVDAAAICSVFFS